MFDLYYQSNINFQHINLICETITTALQLYERFYAKLKRRKGEIKPIEIIYTGLKNEFF